MEAETRYGRLVGANHLKEYGQFFTPAAVARFMVSWAGEGAKTLLDPAAGNSVFLTQAQSIYPHCALTGYEVDGAALAFFGNPAGARLIAEDYLKSEWDQTYDAIVCNPPYHRFQAVGDRENILEALERRTGVRYSGYTNLYALFLLKSTFQLSDTGRLAYLLPSEFLNSQYGTPVKRLLLEERLLRAVINLEQDRVLFPGAVTTSCILLLDRGEKEGAEFYSLPNGDTLSTLEIGRAHSQALVSYERLRPEEKWRGFLKGEGERRYRNLAPLSKYCTVSRGIATGDNGFYCFRRSQLETLGLPECCVTGCICHSAHVKTPIFTDREFAALQEANQTVLLLDVQRVEEGPLARYIALGEAQGVNRKYLPARRRPWYAMEQKAAAPIWASSACRGGIKFVRNLAQVKNLSTFHCVFVREAYVPDTDLIFCCFLTPAVQSLLLQNRKEMGGGLYKFQPNDLNEADMLDVSCITKKDRAEILGIFEEMKEGFDDGQIHRLNGIIEGYLAE